MERRRRATGTTTGGCREVSEGSGGRLATEPASEPSLSPRSVAIIVVFRAGTSLLIRARRAEGIAGDLPSRPAFLVRAVVGPGVDKFWITDGGGCGGVGLFDLARPNPSPAPSLAGVPTPNKVLTPTPEVRTGGLGPGVVPDDMEFRCLMRSRESNIKPSVGDRDVEVVAGVSG